VFDLVKDEERAPRPPEPAPITLCEDIARQVAQAQGRKAIPKLHRSRKKVTSTAPQTRSPLGSRHAAEQDDGMVGRAVLNCRDEANSAPTVVDNRGITGRTAAATPARVA